MDIAFLIGLVVLGLFVGRGGSQSGNNLGLYVGIGALLLLFAMLARMYVQMRLLPALAEEGRDLPVWAVAGLTLFDNDLYFCGFVLPVAALVCPLAVYGISRVFRWNRLDS